MYIVPVHALSLLYTLTVVHIILYIYLAHFIPLYNIVYDIVCGVVLCGVLWCCVSRSVSYVVLVCCCVVLLQLYYTNALRISHWAVVFRNPSAGLTCSSQHYGPM